MGERGGLHAILDEPCCNIASPRQSRGVGRNMERHSSIGSLVLWGLIGGAIGGVLNVLLHVFALFGLGDPMAGDGGMGFMEVPVFLSFVSSVVPGAIAGLVYAALERLASNPTSRFLQVSGAFLVVSLAGPITMQGATTVTVAVLLAMHVIAGVPIMWGVVRGARP